MNEPDSMESRKGAIVRLLFVVAASLLSACALSFFFIYTYGPISAYKSQNVLVSPTTIQSLRLDPIVYIAFNPRTKTMDRTPISQEVYHRFFRTVEGDVSISADEGAAFFAVPFTSLQVYGENGKVVVNQVDFSKDGDYYRVKLLESKGSDSYAFFRHQRILQEMQSVISSPP